MPEFRSYRVEAIILRHTDYGEADRLLTVYSRQLGKLRAIAKGARKVTSRKAGHLEPFTHVSLQLARSRDLPIVTQAETVEAFMTLRKDLILTGHASYILELVDRFTYIDETDSSSIFKLVLESLNRLNSNSVPWLVLRFYELRLLDYLGFRPRLFECANCGETIQAEDQFFSPGAGGVICPRCGVGLSHLAAISVDGLKFLRHLQRSSFQVASRAHPNVIAQRETESIMQGYLNYLLERNLKTPEFMNKIRAIQ